MDDRQLYGFIYIWFDRKLKRYYIGAHWGHENDGYICSSNWMMQAYKIRPQDFKRRILERIYTNKKDTFLTEEKWLGMIKKEEIRPNNNPRYYNIQIKLFGGWHQSHSEEKCKEISEKTKAAMQRPEVQEKYLKGLETRNTRSSDIEVRAKRSKSMMGKNKQNMLSLWQNPEYAANMRQTAKTKKLNKEALSRGGTTTCTLLNSKKVKCAKCGFESNPGLINRHHNDNCKMVDWEKLKLEYKLHIMSLRKLAIKYKIDRRVISNRASKEGWE